MIKHVFVSSGFYKNENSNDILKVFIKKKINTVELSGGNCINQNQIDEIKSLNTKKTKVRIHNYFPPPKSKFVINLASRNKRIVKKSLDQLKKSIILSKELNNKYFSFHAGFRFDPKPKQLGKKFNKIFLNNKRKSERIFFKNVIKLNFFAKKNNVKLLIENNVINKKNLKTFKGNPLLLTNPVDIINFYKKLPKSVGFLLDVGHLKVSSVSENFDLKDGIIKLNKITNGYHLSDNNGLEDQNKNFTMNAWFIKYLKKNLSYYTLEIYQTNLNKIYKTKSILEKFLNKK